MTRAFALLAALGAAVALGQAATRYPGDYYGPSPLPGGGGGPGGGSSYRRLVALGDSITAGVGLSPTYPQRLSTLLGKEVVNEGVGGSTVVSHRNLWTANLRGRGYTDLVYLGGINNVGRDGNTAASTFAVMQQTYDEAMADGMRLTVVTVLPFGGSAWWTSARQAELDALNASIRAYAAAHPGVRLVDAYVGMAGTDPLQLNATYNSGDWIHPNQAGADALAALVYAAVASGGGG